VLPFRYFNLYVRLAKVTELNTVSHGTGSQAAAPQPETSVIVFCCSLFYDADYNVRW
jgi:hypothetical protein